MKKVRTEAAVPRKIQNLLGIEYPSANWEIIVISDGSTDATKDLVRAYAEGPQFRQLTFYALGLLGLLQLQMGSLLL